MNAEGIDLEARLLVDRGDFRLDVELRLPAGTTTALLGPNGAGKSTTVDALAGHLALDGGSIRLGGRVLDAPTADAFVPPEERRVGVVFQDGLLFDHLDAADNVGFGPAVGGLGRRRGRAVGFEWLGRLGLVDLADRRPSQLSGGQAQQVALARTLAAEPELLILDEPLSALDVATRSRLRRFLAERLTEHGGPRLVITHDPTDAFLLADRVVVLEAGRVAQVGSPEEIRRHPTTPYVAALSGRNLLAGRNDAGRLRLEGTDLELRCADTHTAGPVVITIHPNAVALHTRRPEGSPRNVWRATVTAVEPLGEIVRVNLGDPLPLSADVTPSARDNLDIVPGAELWVSVKATEIELGPT